MSALKYWIWLTTRRGLPPEGVIPLLEHFGSLEAVYFAQEAEYRLAGLPQAQREALGDKSLAEAEDILDRCQDLGLRILTHQDADYPERLRQIPGPPGVLYVRGRWFAFDEEVAVGVVGSRKASVYGVEMAGTLGLELARSGALVVSGMAQGIDSAALQGALKGGGAVVSVLASGLDVVYPACNQWLYEDVAAVGALVSEFPPGTRPDGWRFPVRNRIISGLSLGVVAVEAAERSGTLITARLALEQNRDVFAFPGRANDWGCTGTNRLIQRGEAKLILSARDVLVEYEGIYPGRLRRVDDLDLQARQARLGPSATPVSGGESQKKVDNRQEKAYISLKDYTKEFTDDERDVLLALTERSLHPDELVELTQIPARRVLTALTMLQVRGYVEEGAGKRFTSLVVLAGEGETAPEQTGASNDLGG